MTKSKKLRIEKEFWIANIAPVVVVSVTYPELWAQAGVLYLTLLSIWTQVRTLDGAVQAAIAVELAEEDVETSRTSG